MQITKKNYTACVFIGRFQPVHAGHLKIIRLALKQSKILIIVVGSHKRSPSIRQPWSSSQRIQMIKMCLKKEELKRIYFLPIRDRLYSEFVWNQNIIQEVHNLIQKKLFTNKLNNSQFEIALIGHNKDSTSYYLKNFPHWNFIETGNFSNINSTDFRKNYFTKQKPSYKYIPLKIREKLEKFRNTKIYSILKQEFNFVERAKEKSKNSMFFIANSLILCGNYILLIQRKNFPGKNLYALPGGHVENGEKPLNAGIRELYEETNIQIEEKILLKNFKSEHNYNHPERNPVGESCAYVFFYSLPFLQCPNVTAGDDALKAEWILIDELSSLENYFFADHYQIIQILLKRIHDKK
jgi:bifunctional NMN adenylyltransferase/nudix hydrolase